ncbi:MAG: alpha/beta fold hydrolase, partial [Okeania sp. SIO3C4]|nr:alpha/beta fold hydrolase [Okeania sp. SIO3C4]
VTPEDEWQSTVGRKEETDKFTHTIPGDKGGRYYVGFFHYENDQDAYFGLNWKELDDGGGSIELNPGSKGIDVANHQGNVNWQEVKNDGYSFAFVKATEGTTFLDPYFHDNWEEMKDVGISRGAYHYFHPNIDPVQQANYFLNTIGTLEANDLPPVLDVEVSNGIDANGIVNSVRQWLDVVEEGTGRKPIIYTYPYFWENSVGNSQEFADYPLWIAHYDTEQPRVPGGWDDWTFWQKTSSGSVDGIAGNVDLNVFSDNPTDFPSTGGNDSSDNDQWEPYIVQSGDTLSDIAQRATGDSSRYLEIANYNDIDDPNSIYVGQEILVPRNSSTGTTSEDTDGSNKQWEPYIVKSGDTLSDIAQRTTGDSSRYWEIANYNGIDDPNSIYAGQEIQVPGNSSTGTTVEVTTGGNSETSDCNSGEDSEVQTFKAVIQEYEDGVSLYRSEDRSAEIDPNLETTLVIHGWNNNPEDLKSVSDATRSLGDQVLALDWRNPAEKLIIDGGPLSAAGAIAPVAKQATKWLLDEIKIKPDKLTIVGHSLGAHVGAEIGRRFTERGNQIKKLVALDPAYPATIYDINSTQSWQQSVTRLDLAATESLALVVQDSKEQIPNLDTFLKHAWNGGIAGDNDHAKTAHQSFVIDFTGGLPFKNNVDYHGAVAKVYADFLNDEKQIPSDLQKDWYGNDGGLLWWSDTRKTHEGVIDADYLSGEINKLTYVNGRSWFGNAQENTDWA